MQEKIPEWWQQTTGGPTGQINTETNKWYNDWTRLLLSLLFWPLFVYGMYKTILVKKKNKQIMLAIVTCLFIIGMFGNSGSGGSGGDVRNTVQRYIKSHAYDPDSYEAISWDIQKNSDGSFRVTHYFNVKNRYGQDESKEAINCTVSSNGDDVRFVQIWPDPSLGN